MSTAQARYHLNSLKNRYLLIGLTEAILIGVGISMLVYGLAGFFIVSATLKITLAGTLGLLMLSVRIFQNNLFRFNTSHIIQFMNVRYPALQESTDLILRQEDELTLLQQLQREKTLASFENIYPSVKLPNRLVQAIGIFIGCSLSYFALSRFAITESVIRFMPGTQQQIIPTSSQEAVIIESLSIQVTPPSYTAIASYKPKNPSVSIPEGSMVEWTITFSSLPLDGQIIFPGRDSTRLKPAGSHSFKFSQTFSTSAFYQFQWRDSMRTYRSDYHKIDLIKDQPPKISVTNLDQFTELLHTDNHVMDVKADLSDDYGLNDSQLIATVSKGSGEGIKFREEKIRFDTPQNISGKHLTAHTTLDLKKLGLEPGDELYFYVEATDTKTPLSNRNRTETFFISLKDTASYTLTSDEGLGVDLMPEYFRSQRQIIIDTEKLLKQQKEKKITKEKFNATSNELGYDQKVLRLKYGQFLGEEEDSGIPHGTQPGEANHQEEENDEEKDPIKAFGHQHDTKNEHNLVADKKTDTHQHEDETQDEEGKGDPLKGFVHQHDNQEEATFFMISVKTKLKIALSLMWDAELYLRIYTPAQSLPYQYKVLNLLKEISNDSRIYVHRMGFDPPPLKEEKRLTADLAEVQSSKNQYFIEEERKFQGIRKSLMLLETISLQESPHLNVEDRVILTKAGEELAQIAVAQPGTSLKGLSLIRDLIDEKIPVDKKMIKMLQQELWKVLPSQPQSPKKQETTAHELDQKFLQQLEAMKHE